MLVMGPMKRFNIHEGSPIIQSLLMILGVVVLVGLIVATPLVRRVRRLERTAQRISEGDLEARADVSARDAIGSLARRFNRMADRVQALLQSQQELIQAVSHELRTPTSRIRFGLEMLAETSDAEERRQRIASLDEDLTELDQLIEELLLYVRMGYQGQELELQPVQALDEVRDQAGRLQEMRPEVQLEVEARGQDLTLRANPRLFRRALQNLLQNALRHARGRVVVELGRDGEALLLVVRDDGPGVAAEDRQRIFEPFARLDDSRSRQSGGSGLGLAIVQRVMQAHGGTVAVDSAPEGGARFSLCWPAGTDFAGR
jgi:two-component system sensor histidine kinase RstB